MFSLFLFFVLLSFCVGFNVKSRDTRRLVTSRHVAPTMILGGLFRRKGDHVEDESSKTQIPSSSAAPETLLGNVPVKFTCEGEETIAWAFEGQPLSDVAASVDVFIRYKCKKGECGTCEVNNEGKWIRTCQTKIPPVAQGESFNIAVRKVSEKNKKGPSKFFSPASFVEGVVNNGLGVVGFVAEGAKADDEFSVRMEREQKLAELVAKRKAEKESGKSGKMQGV